jgi:glycosyltransferase involved in cell wall biosynthesis
VPQRIIYCSPKARDLHEHRGYDRRRGVVIENGVDLALFSASRLQRYAARQRLGLEAAELAIGAFGRFSPQKGHETLFSALSLLPAALPWRLILAGRGCEPEQPSLVAMVERYGLKGRVLCLGERTDMPDLYGALDLFCLASDFGEASPLSLIEAAAAGVPVVATNVGDVEHLVLKQDDIVPPGEPRMMAEAIVRALEREEADETTHLIETRLERVRARHGIDEFVEAIHAQYDAAEP